MGKLLQTKDVVSKKQYVKVIHRNQYSFVCITVRDLMKEKTQLKLQQRK